MGFPQAGGRGLLPEAGSEALVWRAWPRGAMATAFSSDGEAVLRRMLSPAAAPPAPRGDLDGFYEMGRAAAFVRGGGFRKVSGAGGGGGRGPRVSPPCCLIPVPPSPGRPPVPGRAPGRRGGGGGPDGGGDRG